MKNSIIYFLLGIVCLLSTPALATDELVDDFDNFSLSNYTKSIVLASGSISTETLMSSDGRLYMTRDTGTYPEQIVYLRNDYTLEVGEILRIDSACSTNTFYTDFGIVVSATVDPPDAVYTGISVDVRQSYINMYMKNGSTGWGINSRDGTSKMVSSYVTNQGTNYTAVNGLFIERAENNVFNVGYMTDSGSTIYKTVTFSETGAVGTTDSLAIGIYTDMRGVATYGTMDNLRIVPEPAILVMIMTGIVGLGMRWLRLPSRWFYLSN